MDETSGPVLRASVLIVARNCAEQLRRCLIALEASAGRETFEIVVVDAHSSDDTGRLDAEFPNVSFLRLPKNFGRAKASNIGIRTAKAELILFVSPFVEVAPDTISLLVERMDSDPEGGAVCAFAPRTCSFPTPEHLMAEWKDGAELPTKEVPAGGDVVPVEYPRGAPMLVRKNFLATSKFLDEHFGNYGVDLDLCRRVLASGKKIVMVPQARVTYLEPPEPEGAAVNESDHALGAAAYVSKYFGGGAGFRFRMAAIFNVLVRALTFQRPGYSWELLFAIVGGQRVDGEQPED
jgi:GT2 family glycosyltransferase